MKLTKNQKLEAYTYCLLCYFYEIDQRTDTTVCPNLKEWYVLKYTYTKLTCADVVETYFPEFLSTKPEDKRSTETWWENDSPERLSAIERAIELTEKLKA